ncbi:MAG TPA: OB-fold nucleic acid binding domain-containing protein, partial [Archangium sp.]
MSQTENVQENSEERIRKIYAKDLKIGESVHTVFRAARKEKLSSRGGKSFLSLTLVDRTGEVDARVFENVEAADQAFAADDYLLLKGKVGQFHGKTQIVIDRLERL